LTQKITPPIWNYQIKGENDRVTTAIILNGIDKKNYQIVIGTEKGKVIRLSSKGQTVNSYSTGKTIRALLASPENPYQVIVGNDGGKIILIDSKSRKQWDKDAKDRVSDIIALKLKNPPKNYEIIISCWKGAIHRFKPDGEAIGDFIMPAIVRQIQAADIDDQGPELVIACEDNKLYATYLKGDKIWVYSAPHRVTNVIAEDVNNDNKPEIFLACDDRTVRSVNLKGALQWSYTQTDRPYQIMAVNWEQKTFKDILTLSEKSLTILNSLGELREQYSIPPQIRGIFPLHLEDELHFIVDTYENHILFYSKGSLLALLSNQREKPSETKSSLKLLWKFDGYGETLDKVYNLHALQLDKQAPEILAACGDGYVYFLTSKGKFHKKVKVGKGRAVRSITTIPSTFQEDIILAGSEDNSVYSVDRLGNSKRLHSEEGWINDLQCLSKAPVRLIAVGTQEGKVVFLNGEFKEDYRFNTKAAVRCMDFILNGSEGKTWLVYGTDNHIVATISPQNGKIQTGWQYRTDDKVRTIKVSDIDNDGIEEILIGSEDSKIYCLDIFGDSKWDCLTDGWIRSLAVGDVDNDGEKEIIAGGSSRQIYIIGNDGSVKSKKQLDYEIRTLMLLDLDLDGKLELIVGSMDGVIYAYKFTQSKKV
jgi:outer membrane protein assembly factor BamB